MCVFGLRSGNKTGGRGLFLIQVLLKEVKQDLKMWTLRNVVSYLVCALLVKRGGGSKLIVRVGLFASVCGIVIGYDLDGFRKALKNRHENDLFQFIRLFVHCIAITNM